MFPGMRAGRVITVVGCHAGGEIGNVVTGGVLPPPGATVFEQMEALRRDGDGLRRLLLHEPRGSVACHANLVVPATRPDCDAGFIIMEPTEYPPMSGSNTICTATVLLETGMVEMREPQTTLRLEAPGRGGRGAGRVPGRPLRERRVHERGLLRRARSTRRSRSAGLGTITVDVSYGGMWYAIADARALGFAIEPGEAARPVAGWASASASPPGSRSSASTPKIPASPASASSSSRAPGRASAR